MVKSGTSVVVVPFDRLPPVGMIGYEKQKKAALAMALSVWKGGEKRIVVFGLPGSGTRLFPRAVQRELENSGVRASLIQLRCDDFLLDDDAEAMASKVNEIEHMIEKNASERILSLLVIGNPEALGPEYENFQNRKQLATRELGNLLRKRYERTIVFCASDDPSKVDPSILESFEYPIYLRYLDLDSLAAILGKGLGRADSSKMAEKLYGELTDKRRFNLVSAEIVKAITNALKENPEIQNLPLEKATQLIRDHVFPCYPEVTVNSYEKENRSLIVKSEIVVEQWSKVPNGSDSR